MTAEPMLRDFSRSLPMALMRARESVMREFRPILKRYGLTEQQWRVLRALQSVQAPVSFGELAAGIFLLGPSLSRIVGNLVERGLVARGVLESDARRVELSITEEGRRVFELVAPLSEARYQVIEGRFGPEQLETLYGLLDALSSLSSDNEVQGPGRQEARAHA